MKNRLKRLITVILIFSCSCLAYSLNAHSMSDSFGPDTGYPMAFTENKGQVSDQNYAVRKDILFSGTSAGMVYHLRKNGISYQLYKPKFTETGQKSSGSVSAPSQVLVHRIDVNLVNCNINAPVATEEPLPGVANYYLEVCPNGVFDVRSYAGVTYKDIYDGIDLHYHSENGALKYDYIVAAGADYKQIKIKIEGCRSIQLLKDGKIKIATEIGSIIEGKPVVFQSGKTLKAKWLVNGNTLSFAIEGINTAQPFVIDPITRSWGTYYGDSGTDYISNITTDGSNNVFVSGVTSSSTGTTIATSGSHQSTLAGQDDLFLAKTNSAGIRQWSTYYGGLATENHAYCATDQSNNVYLSGTTFSTVSAVISTTNGHQPVCGGNSDAFLVKFNAAGIRQWGTYYGDAFADESQSCATDMNGNVYLAGRGSGSGTVLATSASHQPTCAGATDAFLAKFSTTGARIWGTFYGTAATEVAFSCCTDASRNVYLCGLTSLGGGTGTAIATSNAHQPALGGTNDAFLVKFDSSGTRQWGTYYGGTGAEQGLSCALDPASNVYLAGTTSTPSSTIIASPNSHQATYGGGTHDCFLAKFNPNGMRLWATYYGGTSGEVARCATDIASNVYLGGLTGSTAGTVIATPGSYQPVSGGGGDGFLVKFNAGGTRLWGSYYGGAASESWGYSVALDNAGSIFLAGGTNSATGTFFATSGAHQANFGGVTDGFFVKFHDCEPLNASPPGNLQICPNNSATLSAVGQTTINWYATASSTLALSSGTSYVTPTLSPGSYTFYAEDSGCVPSATRTAIILTVSPNPTIAVASGSICVGQSFTLSPTGAFTYTFSGDTAIVSPTVNTSYSVTGASVDGCTSSFPAVASISVVSLPTITVNSGSICPGQNFTLSPGGAFTYTYLNGAAIVSPSITSTYSVIGSSQVGCTSSIAGIATITVYPLPTITVNSGTICAGESFTISPTGASTYTISGGSLTVNPTGSSSYSVSGTNSAGCVSTIAAVSNVTVFSLPNLIVTSTKTLLCAGETVTLAVSGANSYTWMTGTIGNSLVISPTLTSNYSLTGINVSGCANTASITQIVDACSGINGLFKNECQVKIYPNPNKGEFIVTHEFNGRASLKIFDSGGRSILNLIIKDQNTHVDISEQAEGIYYIEISDEFGKKQYLKFSKN